MPGKKKCISIRRGNDIFELRGMNPRIYQERIGYLELKGRVFERFNRARILIEGTRNMG